MAINNLGISFLDPSDRRPVARRPQLGGAIQVLGLQLPQILGAQTLAPAALLNSPGSASPQGLAPVSAVGARPSALGQAISQAVISEVTRSGPQGVGSDIITQLTPPALPPAAQPSTPTLSPALPSATAPATVVPPPVLPSASPVPQQTAPPQAAIPALPAPVPVSPPVLPQLPSSGGGGGGVSTEQQSYNIPVPRITPGGDQSRNNPVPVAPPPPPSSEPPRVELPSSPIPPVISSPEPQLPVYNDFSNVGVSPPEDEFISRLREILFETGKLGQWDLRNGT